MDQISDKEFQEIHKNYIGLKYNNTNTEAGFLYVWYHQDRAFYYRLNHTSYKKKRLIKNCFFDYWLRLKGFNDEKRDKIWEKLKEIYGLNLDKDFKDPQFKKTIKRYKKNNTLKDYYYELIFQLNIKRKSLSELKKKLIDKPWEKETDKRLKRALKLHIKVYDYLKINPNVRLREIQRKFSINKAQLEGILKTLNLDFR